MLTNAIGLYSRMYGTLKTSSWPLVLDLNPRIMYEIPWNGGLIRVEASSVEELIAIIGDLLKHSMSLEEKSHHPQQMSEGEYPSISGSLSCKGSISEILASQWGKAQPRIESEITQAMKANSVYYPRGTISGVLAQMSKRGEIRRVGKKNGAFAY